MIAWRRIATALGVAVLTLFGAEFIAHLTLSNIDFGDPYESPRNPNFRRAWLEFTEPHPRAENSKLVIVISNSQGYLRESEHGELAYPKQLEARLRENSDDPIQVANWSIAGGYAPEFVVLAARAATHHPDAIMLVSYGRNFTSAHLERPLSWGVSDADLIGYVPEVRAALPDWFIEHFNLHEFPKYLETYSALIRLRSIISEPKNERWTWEVHGPKESFFENSLKTAGPWRPMSDRLVLALADVVAKISPDTKLIIVGMPFAAKLWHPAAIQVNRFLLPRAQQLYQNRPNIYLLDATQLFPSDPKYFYGHAHLRLAGHAAFADWLAPRVSAILSEH